MGKQKWAKSQQKENQLLKGEAWEKEKCRRKERQKQNKHQKQQILKSGKAEVGIEAAKRETVSERRSMGKGEA